MKKFQMLGTALSKAEQKKIIGGDDPSSVPCNGGIVDCGCIGGTTRFKCCVDTLNACVELRGCANNYACS